MKKLLFTLSLGLPLFTHANVPLKNAPKALWTLNEELKTPESIVYDAASSTYFVSNTNGDGMAKDKNGYISQITLDGKVKKAQWATGLNGPKGLAIKGNSLWASDIDELVEIELKSGKILKKLKIEGAKFLNDIATTPEFVFVSDTLGNQIYKYDGKKVLPISTKVNFDSPNGLTIQDGKLYVSSWGEVTDFSQKPKEAGRIYSISLDGTNKTYLSKSFGNLDGMLKVKNTFYATDWMTGQLYSVDSKGKVTLLNQGKQGYADLEARHENEKTILVIPLMVENKIIALEI